MNGDTISVREATTDDAETISCFGSRAFREANAPIIGKAAAAAAIDQTYTVPALRACICSCAQAPSALFLVAIQNEELVGFLHYDTANGSPELHRIYVHPDRQGNGIGTALLDALHARIPDHTTYRLLVAAENSKARRFYQRHGFVEETRIDRAFFPGVAPPTDAPPVPVIILKHSGAPAG